MDCKLKIFCARRPKGTLGHLIRRSYRPDRDCLNALGLRFRLGDEVAHFVADFAFRGDGCWRPPLFVGQERSAPLHQVFCDIQMVSSNSDVQGRQARLQRRQNRSARDGASLSSLTVSQIIVVGAAKQAFATKLLATSNVRALMMLLSKVAVHLRSRTLPVRGLASRYLLVVFFSLVASLQCYPG